MQRHPLFCALYWNNKYLHIAIYKNNRETLCLIIFVNKQKTSCCKIVKYSSLLYLGTFLSPLSHYFDSSSVVILLKEENRSQRKSESLVDIWEDLDIRVICYRFAIFGVAVCDSYFSRGRRLLPPRSPFSPPPPSFPFSMSSVKIWRKFGKIRLGSGVYVPLQKIKCLR